MYKASCSRKKTDSVMLPFSRRIISLVCHKAHTASVVGYTSTQQVPCFLTDVIYMNTFSKENCVVIHR